MTLLKTVTKANHGHDCLHEEHLSFFYYSGITRGMTSLFAWLHWRCSQTSAGESARQSQSATGE